MDKLFEIIVQSPELLSLYTESTHIQRKVHLSCGVRHYCFRKDFETALDALAYGAYKDLDPASCLLFLYQERCDAWELATELASCLTPRDANGLYEHFKDEKWKELVAEKRLGAPLDTRMEEIFSSTRKSANCVGVSVDLRE